LAHRVFAAAQKLGRVRSKADIEQGSQSRIYERALAGFESMRGELQIVKGMLGFNRQTICWSLNNKRLLREARGNAILGRFVFVFWRKSDAHRSMFAD
jgi:hypothetical protein